MVNKYGHILNEDNYIEKKCIAIIDEHLEMFFSGCSKAAYGYSVMISKDSRNFNLNTFESMIISKDEIEHNINNIVIKVNTEIAKYLGCYITDDNMFTYDYSGQQICQCLNDTLEIYKVTQNITKACERTLKTIFNKAFKNICPYKPAHLLMKKINISDKILGNNSYKNQVDVHQEKLFHQLQGLLINLKTDLRNHIVEKTIENILYIQHNIPKSNNYFIA
ncbi:hypothetical protein [Serpentinicella alkaliphila]|uniref:Uncharacterized protein n=1 Tax=Serpentinicella alkaliphila TaxID=1734049 RepID=A0A4R2T0B2_9FIRM|nr:hypothetical protein [Serpentinicella alkaliphila]QUH25858.1 hypothetical protein HZR23_08990 [Serpentinicella alkaliphila]TCP95295.1 hypothetical protein EDD79_10611 [Serpentinicella alkaliphila]